MEVKANKARMAKGKEKRTEKKRRYREKKKECRKPMAEEEIEIARIIEEE